MQTDLDSVSDLIDLGTLAETPTAKKQKELHVLEEKINQKENEVASLEPSKKELPDIIQLERERQERYRKEISKLDKLFIKGKISFINYLDRSHAAVEEINDIYEKQFKEEYERLGVDYRTGEDTPDLLLYFNQILRDYVNLAFIDYTYEDPLCDSNLLAHFEQQYKLLGLDKESPIPSYYSQLMNFKYTELFGSNKESPIPNHYSQPTYFGHSGYPPHNLNLPNLLDRVNQLYQLLGLNKKSYEPNAEEKVNINQPWRHSRFTPNEAQVEEFNCKFRVVSSIYEIIQARKLYRNYKQKELKHRAAKYELQCLKREYRHKQSHCNRFLDVLTLEPKPKPYKGAVLPAIKLR